MSQRRKVRGQGGSVRSGGGNADSGDGWFSKVSGLEWGTLN